MEAIPDPAVDEALRAAAGKLKGMLLVGVIDSMGARRDAKAADALVELLGDADAEVSAAAAAALGRIGTPQAAEALTRALADAPPARRAPLADACLACAERLSDQAKPDQAVALYDALRKAELPRHLAVAATRGAIISRGAGGVPLLVEQLRKADDRTMVRLALRLAREMPGPAVTEALAAELGKLPPEVQVPLIGALVARGGPGVRGVIQTAAAGDAPAVRVAALEALGQVGDASCIALLIRAAQAGKSAEESNAALSSLRELKADDADAAIAAALAPADPKLRARLIGVLADRGAASAVGELLKQAAGPDAGVREAAFRALGSLCGPKDAPPLIGLLTDCKDDAARDWAERAVRAAAVKDPNVWRRGEAVLAALASAKETHLRCSLLRVLEGIANYQAVDAVRSALKDDDAAVRDTALRALAGWPDATPTGLLLEAAATADQPAHRALALRGAVRLAALVAADCDGLSRQVIEWLARADRVAQSADEKKLVLSGLARAKSAEALRMIQAHLDDEGVQSEAALAVIQVATDLAAFGQHDLAKAALEKVAATVKNEPLRQKAVAAAKQLQAATEYLVTWQVCGPYDQPPKECQQLFDVPFGPEKPGERVEWQLLTGEPTPQMPHLVNLPASLSGPHRVAYARTWLFSDADRPAKIEAGFDDGGKAWLNGEAVLSANTAGACVPGAHKADLKLRKGWNLLLLKLTQHSGPWQFCLRLTGPDGKALAGLKVDVAHDAAAAPPAGPGEAQGKIDFDKIAPVSLFDGKTLTGWEGDVAFFSARDGAIVAGQLTSAIARSGYLISTREFGDFELRALIRTVGPGTNGGIQFRGRRKPDSVEMTGFQADVMDGHYWGCMYDCTRGGLLVTVDQKDLAHIVRPGDWNECIIRAEGNRTRIWLNGYKTVDWVEPDPKIERKGRLGLQTHQGPPGEVWYKDLVIRAAP